MIEYWVALAGTVLSALTVHPAVEHSDDAVPSVVSSAASVTSADPTEANDKLIDRFAADIRVGSSVRTPRQILGGTRLWFFVNPNFAVRGGAVYGKGKDFESWDYSADLVVGTRVLEQTWIYASAGASAYSERSSATGRELHRTVVAPEVGGGLDIRIGPTLSVFGEGTYMIGEYGGSELVDGFDVSLVRGTVGIRYGVP